MALVRCRCSRLAKLHGAPRSLVMLSLITDWLRQACRFLRVIPRFQLIPKSYDVDNPVSMLKRTWPCLVVGDVAGFQTL